MNSKIKSAAAILGGIGAGATIMYLMDPDRGARRRELIRDKASSTVNDAKDAVVERSKYIKDTAQDLLHDAGELVSAGNGKTKRS